jgi:hypothetical protein
MRQDRHDQRSKRFVGRRRGREWTGGVFDASGTRFFVSIQHAIGVGTSSVFGPGYAHGYVLEIDGWR